MCTAFFWDIKLLYADRIMTPDSPTCIQHELADRLANAEQHAKRLETQLHVCKLVAAQRERLAAHREWQAIQFQQQAAHYKEQAAQLVAYLCTVMHVRLP